MPSELQRVAEQLLACLNEAPRAVGYLHDRARKCREAAAWIGSQSNNPSARMAAMQLDEAARRCEEAAHYLSLAEARAKQWVEQMVSGVRTVEPSGGSTGERPLGPGGSARRAERRPDDKGDKPEADKPGNSGGAGDDDSAEDQAAPGRRISDEEGRRLQRKLPRREDIPVTSPKTRGTWVDENGNEENLVSGEHDEFEAVKDFLRERGLLPLKGDVTTPSHVETKFAMRMRLRGLKHETIMVNKLPCKGRWGCETFLPYILPPGSTLTVFGPDGFKRTYPSPKTRSDDEQG
ncbi:DddA-like double-stranded DNA deaminase toxin [Kribbella solani]|uniref:DddA-like double-stranded DNA deaminase toxin n=1 Tax=Kribbella solani TaxID=236067 RepID=UPI0029B56718|nr:DddA-like double-stranded DNA deaminase toxin [Kribbella solani]MDX2972364.1 SCP1.201-like deaminase [Kribbella solani]